MSGSERRPARPCLREVTRGRGTQQPRAPAPAPRRHGAPRSAGRDGTGRGDVPWEGPPCEDRRLPLGPLPPGSAHPDRTGLRGGGGTGSAAERQRKERPVPAAGPLLFLEFLLSEPKSLAVTSASLSRKAERAGRPAPRPVPPPAGPPARQRPVPAPPSPRPSPSPRSQLAPRHRPAPPRPAGRARGGRGSAGPGAARVGTAADSSPFVPRRPRAPRPRPASRARCSHA